jgi:hypothetical protein
MLGVAFTDVGGGVYTTCDTAGIACEREDLLDSFLGVGSITITPRNKIRHLLTGPRILRVHWIGVEVSPVDDYGVLADFDNFPPASISMRSPEDRERKRRMVFRIGFAQASLLTWTLHLMSLLTLIRCFPTRRIIHLNTDQQI